MQFSITIHYEMSTKGFPNATHITNIRTLNDALNKIHFAESKKGIYN